MGLGIKTKAKFRGLSMPCHRVWIHLVGEGESLKSLNQGFTRCTDVPIRLTVEGGLGGSEIRRGKNRSKKSSGKLL